MMKRILYITCLFLTCTVAAWGQSEHKFTTEHVIFSCDPIVPGGEYTEITVSLASAKDYAAFGLNIYLPENLEFVQVENDDEDMVYVEKGKALKTTHILGGEIQNDGALRVTSLSIPTDNFKTKSTDLFRFFVKASTFTKPGNANIAVRNCFYTDADAVQYDTDDANISVSISTSAQSPLTIKSENKWSTLILPFNSSVPTGVTAYTCNSKDEAESVLNLIKVTSLKAFTPYILYSENGYEGTLAGTVVAEDYPASGVVSAGLLKGAITQQVATSGEYVLANQNNGTRFYKVTEGKTKTIPAGKCWVSFPSGSAKENFGFYVTPTGIKNVEANVNKSDKVYSIDGKQIKNGNPRGLYITNGRKMIGK